MENPQLPGDPAAAPVLHQRLLLARRLWLRAMPGRCQCLQLRARGAGWIRITENLPRGICGEWSMEYVGNMWGICGNIGIYEEYIL